MSILINLYFEFLKIGAFTIGGGLASLGLIEQSIVMKLKWISSADFLNLLTISEMTPGPIAINAATFIGVQIYGVLGGVVATLGAITPSFVISLIMSFIIKKHGNTNLLKNIFTYLKMAIIGVIGAVAVNIGLQVLGITLNSLHLSNINFGAMLIVIILVVIKRIKPKISPISLILFGGLINLVLVVMG